MREEEEFFFNSIILRIFKYNIYTSYIPYIGIFP